MDDDFGADDDFLAALAATESSLSTRGPGQGSAQKIQQPTPQRVERNTPQRLDRPPPSNPSAASGSKIVQPTPQALPSRSSGSSILVSPRQKGNPVLANLKSMPWEYSDIVADYGLGLTTCALFLSLKYHRLHPEYIYTRIRNLQGKYNLRILLTMVDIPNHEDSLRELSKTSIVNNVTVILCWSAAEAARYLELYKSYEHANFSAIRGQQATGYAEKLVEFVTVPRSINKADAVALVSSFGSLRHAINADPEQVSVISGWGERKVKNWCKVVEEPFRVKKAAKRRVGEAPTSSSASRPRGAVLDAAVPIGSVSRRDKARTPTSQSTRAAGGPLPGQDKATQGFEADEEALMAGADPEVNQTQTAQAPRGDDRLSDGIAAALARLRSKG
ncbi:DNA repair protein rad10 [Lasiosphaeria ovina]|uniref:DNA repair protein rad10 n=1 Tax=Lasiosphaeria ovina TaxID=92902 RepID=A0AAE0NMU9_9PEZI|nr:DNA repair protein rad10 [Lasiosphaeria ovina]